MVDPDNGKIRKYEAIELDIIQSAIKAAGGNVSRASKQLGLSRVTVYRKINKFKSAAEQILLKGTLIILFIFIKPLYIEAVHHVGTI